MSHFSKSNRFASLQRLTVLCALLAATSVQAAGGTREPPSGTNGWTPVVTTPAETSAPAPGAAALRGLPKSGR